MLLATAGGFAAVLHSLKHLPGDSTIRTAMLSASMSSVMQRVVVRPTGPRLRFTYPNYAIRTDF